MVYEDGVKYVGEWKNNWREGRFCSFKHVLLVIGLTAGLVNNASCCWFILVREQTGKGTLFQSDGSIFKGQFVGDEKVEGVVQLEDGILRRERYVNGVLQQD